MHELRRRDVPSPLPGPLKPPQASQASLPATELVPRDPQPQNVDTSVIDVPDNRSKNPDAEGATLVAAADEKVAGTIQHIGKPVVAAYMSSGEEGRAKDEEPQPPAHAQPRHSKEEDLEDHRAPGAGAGGDKPPRDPPGLPAAMPPGEDPEGHQPEEGAGGIEPDMQAYLSMRTGTSLEENVLHAQTLEVVHRKADRLLAFQGEQQPELLDRARERAEYLRDSIRTIMLGDEQLPPETAESLENAIKKLSFTFTNPENHNDTPDDHAIIDLVAEALPGEIYDPSDIPGVATYLHNLASHMMVVRDHLAERGVLPDIPFAQQLTHVKEYLELVFTPNEYYQEEEGVERPADSVDIITPEVADSFMIDFEPYQQFVARVDAQLKAGAAPEAIEGYLSRGVESYIFETPDGTAVVKLPWIPDMDEGRVLPGTAREEYIEPLLRGVDDPYLERIITYSEAGDGAIVCERAPGKTLEEWEPQELYDIGREHFDPLMPTFGSFPERRICMYFDDSKVMLDPAVGFTLIEYSPVERYPYLPSEPIEVARGFIGAVLGRYSDRFDFGEPKPLPPTGRNFYDSFKAAFGSEAANDLLRQWRNEGFVMPDDLG